MTKQLTQQVFADHVGVARQNITVMVGRGSIDLTEGLDVSRLKYINILREAAAGRASENGFDLVEERARLAHHQADKTELEVATLRGELIPAEIVKRVQGDMVSAYRARSLSIPTKAAHELLGLDDLNEAQDILKSYIYEALDELADWRPQLYGIMGDDSEHSKTPAVVNS